MKCFILLLFWSVMVTAIINLEQSRQEWKQFKLDYKKRYTSAAEDLRRLAIYVKNKLEIVQHNKLFQQGKVSYKLQLNEYSDMSHDEFLNTMTSFDYDIESFEIDNNSTGRDIAVNSRVLKALPDHVDWREKGAVTAVKSQGHCGSCWAFSATGALESQVFLKTNRLIPLSEQNLVDCAANYGCRGCHGGSMNRAYNYIKNNGGIESEESYPYRASQSECRFDSNHTSTTVTGYVKLRRSEDTLKAAVANNGPIAVAIHTTGALHHYNDGVFYDKDCYGRLGHAVLVVGYGTDTTGGDYWLVKNSWGRRWGNNGYIKMARNRDNNCNIVNLASYPLIP